MRWFIRILLLFAFTGMAWLALRPYLPAIEREAKHLYTAWQQVRHAEGSEQTPEQIEPSAELPAQAPRRQVLIPLVSESTSPPEPQDPFISEVRQRAQTDPQSAMEWLQAQSSGSQRLRGMLEVVALWAADDSESALLWLESNAQGLARLETLSNGVELWAAKNPAAAAEWIDGMANDGSKVTAAKALVSNWAKTQPDEAAGWVQALPDGPVREKAAFAFAESWMAEDPDAASAWVLQEAKRDDNPELLMATIASYAKKDPRAAEAFLRESNTMPHAESVIRHFVITRAQADPIATAEWLANLPSTDPLYSDAHAGSLMKVWGNSDSIAASEWLSQQPPGNQRDAAAFGFSQSIETFDPEAAVAWAESIGQSELRRERLSESLSLWLRTAPDAAAAWMESTSLEPDIQAQLNDITQSDQPR